MIDRHNDKPYQYASHLDYSNSSSTRLGYANAMHNSLNATMNIQHDNRNNSLILNIKYQTSPETPHLVTTSVPRTYGLDVSKCPARSCSTESTPILHIFYFY